MNNCDYLDRLETAHICFADPDRLIVAPDRFFVVREQQKMFLLIVKAADP